MKSLSKMDKMMVDEHGKAIARAMSEEKARMEKDMAKAKKRKHTMLERAAEKALSGGSAM